MAHLVQYFCNEVSEGDMSEDDVATFLTCQTMVDGIVLTTDTGYFFPVKASIRAHVLQQKQIN